MRRNYRIFSFLIVTALILACAPTLAPVSTPAPVFDPNSVNTAIVLTSDAAATQTALMQPPTLTPTVTLLPTNTFLPSETPTATFIFILPTSTVPSSTPTPEPTQEGSAGGAQFACRIDSQSPADNAVFAQGADFDAVWQVTNTGSNGWDATSADYRYVSGDKIHKTPAYDFSKTVGVGKTTNIIVDMKAPGSNGTYSTTWKISIGKTKFCTMKLTIVVR